MEKDKKFEDAVNELFNRIKTEPRSVVGPYSSIKLYDAIVGLKEECEELRKYSKPPQNKYVDLNI